MVVPCRIRLTRVARSVSLLAPRLDADSIDSILDEGASRRVDATDFPYFLTGHAATRAFRPVPRIIINAKDEATKRRRSVG